MSLTLWYQPERDGYDGYASAENLLALRRELHPEEKASSPNVTLRVPTQSDWVLQHERTPSAVVAADLLESSDERVRRAALRAFERLFHGTSPPAGSPEITRRRLAHRRI